MNQNSNLDAKRRGFFKNVVVTLMATVAGRFIVAAPAHAEEAQKLSESDSTAKAMGYVEDASRVDTAKFTKRAGPDGATQFCKNCQLYSGGASGYGPCAIFGGKLVNAEGWCSSWIKKSG